MRKILRQIVPLGQGRYMLQILVAGGLGLLASWLFGLEPLGGMLVVFYAMLAMQPTLGGTLHLIIPFFGWTLVGIGVGLATAWTSSVALPNEAWSVWPAMGVGVIFGAFVVPHSPFARLSVITALLVTVGGLQIGAPLTQALMRGLYVLISAFLSVSVAYLVFPRRASHVVQTASKEVLHKERALFAALIEGLRTPTLEWDEEARVEEARMMREEVLQYCGLQEHVRREGHLLDRSFVRQMARGENRMITYLLVLMRMADQVRSHPLLDAAQPVIAELALAVQKLMGVWEEMIDHGVEKLELPSLEVLDLRIEEFLQSQKERLKLMPSLIAFLHCLRLLVGGLSQVVERLWLLDHPGR